MSFNFFVKATAHIKIAALTLLPLICCVNCKKTEPQETKDVPTIVQSWDCEAKLSWFVRCELYSNMTLRVFGEGAMENYNSFAPWSSSDITSAVIEGGVTTIGENAFRGCDRLKSITIPNSVTSIGDGAFEYCNSLKFVTIPNSVTSIGDEAFQYCNSLKSVTIPNSVTYIGEGAFYHSYNLSSVTIPNSVVSIGKRAFGLCSVFVAIPSSVAFIGERAFNYATSINVVYSNPNYSSIEGVLFNKNKTKLIQYPVNKKDTTYTIPNSVTTIGKAAFSGATGLIYITIPNSVTFIEDLAFSDLISIITIPIGVTSIIDDTFKFSSKLVSFTCLNPVPPKIDALMFSDVSMYACLYVPAGSRAAYRAADVWKDFKCIRAVK